MLPPTEQDIINLRAALKRCSTDTIEAAVRFRTTGDPAEIPTVVYGIIERHLPPENARSLADASDETKLIEDLGIDSLTLLEIVLSIEETTNISIENEELREILTLGQVKEFIKYKIATAGEEKAEPKSKIRRYTQLEVGLRLPQQPPFFFLGDAEIDGNTVRSQYVIRGDEYFLEGHFKNDPVMPASLVFEAIGQAACLWVVECAPEQLHMELGTNEVLFASMEEAHFYRRAKPGDTLELEAELIRLRAPLAVFRGKATLRGERLAQIEHLVLAFGSDVAEHLAKKEREDAGVLDVPLPTATTEPTLTTGTEPAKAVPASEMRKDAGDPILDKPAKKDGKVGKSVTAKANDDLPIAEPDPEAPQPPSAKAAPAAKADADEEDEHDRNFGI